jgi:hypothetical protein
MAPPKKKGKLSKSAKYYREHPEAREKKKQTDTKINRRPEQRAKRSELKQARRDRGIDGRGGDDLSHENGKLVRRDPSKNRGNKSNTKGDRNARG